MVRYFYVVFLCVSLIAISVTTHAIEVQVGTRAQSMGMAFTAVADDPSAVLHNPAGLTQIKNTEIDVGVGLQYITLDYDDIGITNENHPSTTFQPVPYFFASTDAVGPVVLGVGFYTPWGTKATVKQTAAGFPYMHSELARFDLTFAAAYQFLETLSAGVGMTVGYTRLKNDIPNLSEEATGFGVSGVAGILWQPAEWFKAGLSYRAPMRAKLSGDATVAGVNDSFTADLNYPGTLSFGVAVLPIDKLTVSVDFDWTDWSFFDRIVRKYETLGISTTQLLNGETAHDLRIGFEYRALEKTHFRWGYSYQQAGWPEQTILPTELEYPMHVVAVGMSQYFWKMRLDAGYELSLPENRHVENNINGFNGDYDGTRHIFLLTTAFMF